MAFGGDNVESYYDEGVTASMKGDLPRALEFFERAIGMDRSFVSAYHQMGKVYLRMGQGQRAAEYLQHVLKNNPRQVPARIDLGYAMLQLGKREEARNQFSQVVGLQPDNSRGHLGLAQVYFQEGDWTHAVAEGEAALTQTTSNFSALFLVGRAARLSGNLALANSSLQSADRLIEKTIEVNPSSPEGYYLRGEINFTRDQFSTALENYRSAEDHGEDGRFYGAFGENFTVLDILAKQGLCYQQLDKLDRARELGERICRLEPENTLGQSLRDL